MTWIFTALSTSLGRTAAIALVCFVAGFVVCWRWTHRTPRASAQSYRVAATVNGATLQVVSGVLGRQRKTVMLAGIAAPGMNDPCGPESQKNLEELAGDAVRLTTASRRLGSAIVAESCFGAGGDELDLAQLKAGLARCETGATKEQLAAEKAARRAKRGLWAIAQPGQHWWHFSLAHDELPEPIPEAEEEKESAMFPLNLETLSNALLIFVVLATISLIAWHFLKPAIAAKSPATAAAVSTAIDTTEQLASYGALTLVRHTPAIAADPQAVQYCDYLRTVCTSWKPLAK